MMSREIHRVFLTNAKSVQEDLILRGRALQYLVADVKRDVKDARLMVFRFHVRQGKTWREAIDRACDVRA
jgi:hypothetical protein